jgi:purine-binding chemotaxis protein CheW
MNSHSDRQAILKARAKQLSALEKMDLSTKGKTIEIVEFKIASETYALESLAVREVHLIKEFTPLPCVPSFVVGLMSVRRKVLSLIDLSQFFDLPKISAISGKKALILEHEDMEFAVLTEGTIKISLLQVADIHPPLVTLSAKGQDFLKGITLDGRIILDAQKMFQNNLLIVDEVP